MRITGRIEQRIFENLEAAVNRAIDRLVEEGASRDEAREAVGEFLFSIDLY